MKQEAVLEREKVRCSYQANKTSSIQGCPGGGGGQAGGAGSPSRPTTIRPPGLHTPPQSVTTSVPCIPASRWSCTSQ